MLDKNLSILNFNFFSSKVIKEGLEHGQKAGYEAEAKVYSYQFQIY